LQLSSLAQHKIELSTTPESLQHFDSDTSTSWHTNKTLPIAIVSTCLQRST